MIRSKISMLYLAAVLVLVNSAEVLACTACFGQSDSRMAQGMNMGIAALLLVITCVLGGVAGFFVYLARRGAQIESTMQTGVEKLSHNSTNV